MQAVNIVLPLYLKNFINDLTQNVHLCDKITADQIRWNDLYTNNHYDNKLKLARGIKGFIITNKNLENFLELNGLDFLIRGHQDNNANTVLFSSNINNNQQDYAQGINIQSLLPKKNKNGYNFSNMKGNLNDNVTTLGEILIKTSSRELKLCNDNKQIEINDERNNNINNNDRL